jgi:hypothetical protein
MTKKKVRADKKVGQVMRHNKGSFRAKPDITRDQFHALVKKAAQPVKDTSEFGSASLETSESHRSDDYSEKNTH